MHLIVRRWLLGLAIAFIGATRALAGPEIKINDNMFVVPDPKAKIITMWMIVHAGCREEEHGSCHGLAHYLEHLMFLGRDAQQSAAAFSAFGDGQTNAFTSLVATSYYQTIPARADTLKTDLDRLFQLFAGRLREVNPPPAAADRERNVIMQEFNFRRSDGPRARVNDAVNAAMQPEHPIGQPIIGSRDDIRGYTVEAAREFHRRWYMKKNITFVIYGPVNADDVKALATQYIDPLPDTRAPEKSWLDARRIFATLDKTVSVADPEIKRNQFQYERLVRFEDPDPLRSANAWALLADYLNSELDGSPYDVFVERGKLLRNIQFDRTPIGDGALWYAAVGTQEDGVDFGRARAAIDAYVAELAKKGLGPETIDRLKKRRFRDLDDADSDPKRTLAALTRWFSSNGTYADWNRRRETLESIDANAIAPLLAAMAGPARSVVGLLTPPDGASAEGARP